MAGFKHELSSDDDDVGCNEDGDFQYQFNYFNNKKIKKDELSLHTTVHAHDNDDQHDQNVHFPHGDLHANDIRKVNSSFTRLVAGDLHRIQPENLQGKYMCQLTEDEIATERKRRNKCKVYYLMTAASLEELNQYIDLVLMSFKIDHIYPFDHAWTEKFDRDLAVTNIEHIKKTNDVVLKRAFIWLGLYLSRKFLSVFCPRPDDSIDDTGSPETNHSFRRYTKEFTANPALLGPFVMSKESPFACVVSARLVGLINMTQFVAIATKLWMEHQPWQNHENWGHLDADDIGHDVKLLMAPPAAFASNRNGASPNRLLK